MMDEVLSETSSFGLLTRFPAQRLAGMNWSPGGPVFHRYVFGTHCARQLQRCRPSD